MQVTTEEWRNGGLRRTRERIHGRLDAGREAAILVEKSQMQAALQPMPFAFVIFSPESAAGFAGQPHPIAPPCPPFLCGGEFPHASA
jgi:hypothetical protein